MIDVALIALCSVCLTVALGALYLLGRFSIAQGRFDTDAMQRAVHLRRYMDVEVERRIAYAPKAVLTRTGAEGPIPTQPVDPGVRAVGRIDEVHELEREEARLRGDEDDFEPREHFEAQPMVTT
jgi:hypothetical protein